MSSSIPYDASQCAEVWKGTGICYKYYIKISKRLTHQQRFLSDLSQRTDQKQYMIQSQMLALSLAWQFSAHGCHSSICLQIPSCK